MGETSRTSDTRTVLVVDDEPAVRMVVRELLEDLGHSVLEAHQADVAEKILRSTTPVDLLITDIILRGHDDGLSLAQIARVAQPRLKILFMTGAPHTMPKGFSAAQVLLKPFGMEEFSDRIEDILSERDTRAPARSSGADNMPAP